MLAAAGTCALEPGCVWAHVLQPTEARAPRANMPATKREPWANVVKKAVHHNDKSSPLLQLRESWWIAKIQRSHILSKCIKHTQTDFLANPVSTLLALKVKEETMSQWMQADPRGRKEQETDSPLETPEGKWYCQHLQPLDV